MARRVFQLAKELGVKSTAIVTKCQAEGLDIKNHMSTLSAGLEATIREWFTTGENTTTVETTAPVDLEKVKTKKKRSTKKKEETAETATEDVTEETTADEETEQEEKAAAVAVVEAPVVEETPAASAPADVAAEPEAPVEANVTAETPAEEKPKRKSPKELEEETQAKVAEDKPAEPEAEAETETPEEPDETAEPDSPVLRIIKQVPLANQVSTDKKQEDEKSAEKPQKIDFTPAPAVLKGPKVIRSAPVDHVPSPPPRSRRPAASAGGSQLNVGGGPVDSSTDTGHRRRKKGKDFTEEQSDGDAKRNKMRQQKRRGSKRYESTYSSTPEWGDRDLQERQQRLAQASGSQLHRRERQLARGEDGTVRNTTKVQPKKIENATVKEPITVKELSSAIGVRANDIIGKLMGMGVMATINQTLNGESAIMVAMEFGVDLTVEEKISQWDELIKEFEAKESEATDDMMKPRPPVVAFLGHVDHGKTSLLDRIRKASVTSGEAGGITQHIGSYQFNDGNRKITFLDTPGHKAFTEMRARGANMTDVLVLVIAADDGVMPQTEEAINHAKAAGVPIIVALNKMDLPNVDEHRVLGQLSEKGLVPAEWGGDTEIVRTSATTGLGIDDLLEHLEYIAELHNLRAVEEGNASGWVVESKMTVQQGVVVRLLLKNGTLKPGDTIVSGSSFGRIRTISDSAGNEIESAGPSMPVIITGLDEVPVSGDRFFAVDNVTRAAAVAEEQKNLRREKTLAQRRQVTLENLFTEIAAGEVKELNVIVKADVQGSVDVLSNTIMEMNTSEVAVRILHSAVGGISESDVVLAQASNAIIIGFQVVADDHAKALADQEGVEIRLYRVIYQISDDIKKALEGMLKPRIEEKPLGRAEVRQLFRVSRIGVIAGCMVIDGVINRSAKMRVIRDSVVIRDDNPITSLRRVKDDANEVRNGYECGIKLEGFDDLKTGDILEAYELVQVSRTLDSVD